MDEMRVGSLVGTLTCHEFLLRILAGAIQDPLPPPFLWFRIWISFLGINPPPAHTVLVGMSIRRPAPSPLRPRGWHVAYTKPTELLLVSRALNLGWRNLLELIHCSSSTQGRPSILFTWTPRTSSISVPHQAWFCTLPADFSDFLDILPIKSFCFDLTRISACCLQKKSN